jgi:hypothetical protein
MAEVQQTPMTLFDQPDDWPDTCWVEVTVGDADAARDYLAESCADVNCASPFRPVGPATREWHRCTDQIVPEGEVWEACKPTDKGAVEFWRVEVY